METEIIQLESGIISLTREDRRFIGFKISSSNRPDVTVIKQAHVREKGYLVRAGRVEEWISAGHHEHEGRYLIGPWLEGHSLESQLDSIGIPLLELLIRVAAAAKTLKISGIFFEEIDASSIYLLNDGGTLFLQSSISKRQRACISEAERRRGFEEINHPDIRGEKNLSFVFAILAYRALSGTHPFRDEGVQLPLEELRNRMRKGKFLPLQLQSPSLESDALREIDDSLKAGDTFPALERWGPLLNLLKDALQSSSVPVVEQERRRLEARRQKQQIVRRRNIEEFLRRYRVSLLVGVVILAVVGSMASTIIGNVLKPPVTAGMSPVEVTSLFYNSMNSFDHMTMEDCVTDGAGKGAIREATNLFVISRMRQGYERGENPYLDVNEWIADGRPELPPGKSLYGIGNLKITALSETEFRVSYEKWVPNTSDTPDAAPVDEYIGQLLVDLVKLKTVKEVYRIYSMETVERQELDPAGALKKD